LHEKTIEFLKAQAPRLADMSPEDYAENQEGLIAQLLERDKNLGSRAWRYWVDLDDQYLNFDRRQQLADAIAATDQKTLRAYLDALLIKTEQQYLLIQSLGKLAAVSDA
jgi:protease-3